jgi:hypothetical protein
MADFGIGEALAAIGAAAADAAAGAGAAIGSAASAIGDAAAGAGSAIGSAASSVGDAVGSMSLGQVAAATSIVGTGISALGQLTAGSQKSQALTTNAAISQQQAATATSQAEAQAGNDQVLSAQRLGEITADYGASGVDVGSGSPLSVVSNNAAQAELTRQTDVYRGIVQSNADLTQAGLDETAAQQAALAGYTGAAGTLFSGIGTAARNASPFFSTNSNNNPTSPASGAMPYNMSGYEF